MELESKTLPRGSTPPNNIGPHPDYSNSHLPPSCKYLSADEQYPEGPSV